MNPRDLSTLDESLNFVRILCELASYQGALTHFTGVLGLEYTSWMPGTTYEQDVRRERFAAAYYILEHGGMRPFRGVLHALRDPIPEDWGCRGVGSVKTCSLRYGPDAATPNEVLSGWRVEWAVTDAVAAERMLAEASETKVYSFWYPVGTWLEMDGSPYRQGGANGNGAESRELRDGALHINRMWSWGEEDQEVQDTTATPDGGLVVVLRASQV